MAQRPLVSQEVSAVVYELPPKEICLWERGVFVKRVAIWIFGSGRVKGSPIPDLRVLKIGRRGRRFFSDTGDQREKKHDKARYDKRGPHKDN